MQNQELSVHRTRRIPLLAAAVGVALVLAGCSGGGSGGGSDSKAASATSLSDIGKMSDLVAAAKKEGALNVIALPHDWANYGAVITAFKQKYPGVKVNEAAPTDSSEQEIQAAKTNKGLSNAPDVFDLGLTVALQNTSLFAPYKVSTWGDVPTDLKDPKGRYTGDYGGYMAIGYDSSKYPAPTSLNDLLKPVYKSAVALNGDPTEAGSAFAAVGLAAVQSGGSVSDFEPGIQFFKKLKQAGNLLKVDPTTATVASGETPVVFDWDYLSTANTAANKNWKVVLLPGTGYAGYYNQAISADAPHPAAARLWEEFLYSDQGQNLWLGGGARPARAEAMQKAGTIDAAKYKALPAAPAKTVVPSQTESTTAASLLSKEWAAATQ
jgi:putative spermidine/putrescine transport system substrate-binding protein